MHCVKAARQLQLYVDQQLTLEEIRTLESHLSTCPSCRQELLLLEEISHAIRSLDLLVEPADLTKNIMCRVALQVQQQQQAKRERTTSASFRPSLRELCLAVILSTCVMLGVIVAQPTLRATLPIANGHDLLSLLFVNLWNTLITINSGTLMAGFWIFGTLLGIWITLALAGAEMRTIWLKAVTDRLPVW